MSVIQSLQNLFSASRINQPRQAQQGLKPFLQVDSTASSDFRRARDKLLDLYRNLERLAALANVDTQFRIDLPDARSATGLGLDLTNTAATLDSAEEINAAPMSFTPFGPAWDDGSDALITIGGEYDGTHGNGELFFEVRRAGTRGDRDLRIRVEDPQGNRIRNINIRTWHDLDRQYDLRNGLYLTLGSGSLINRDSTTIQVSDSIGAAVDPDKPLGGIRNDNPNLQFGGPSIVDGAFLLNGESISVSTSDSINDVVARINASSAGVTATFNAGTERIEFLQDTLGSVPTIELQGDTSNFLEATKLDIATVVPGIDPEDERVFADVGAFSTIQSGDFRINGTDIAIDASTDSLTAVIDRINASEADVVASFDADTQRVVIEARESARDLTLDGNGTGFFAALNIPEGRVDPEAISRGISRRRSYGIADAAGDAFGNISELFRDSSFIGRGANASQFRAPLEAVIRGAFEGKLSGELFGLRFDGSEEARLRGDFANIDRRALTRSLQFRGDAVQQVLEGQEGAAGLIENLLRGTRQALTNVNQALGISGTFIDTFA